MDFSEESRPAIADMRNVPSKLPDVPDVSNVHSVPNFADVSDLSLIHISPKGGYGGFFWLFLSAEIVTPLLQ